MFLYLHGFEDAFTSCRFDIFPIVEADGSISIRSSFFLVSYVISVNWFFFQVLVPSPYLLRFSRRNPLFICLSTQSQKNLNPSLLQDWVNIE
jgi:hypothetical protein